MTWLQWFESSSTQMSRAPGLTAACADMALAICVSCKPRPWPMQERPSPRSRPSKTTNQASCTWTSSTFRRCPIKAIESEEHTSELQSRQYIVCRLLLEKKTSPLTTIKSAQTDPYLVHP